MQVNLPLTIHKWRKRKRLPPRASTVVKHRLLRLNINPHGEQLRPLILYFKVTSLILNQRKETLLWFLIEPYAIGSILTWREVEAIFFGKSAH